MRGKVVSGFVNWPWFWITPAYAGKSYNHIEQEAAMGITPAYAGKSYCSLYAGVAHQDHPRVCGEKGEGSGICRGLLGSPPRMRGKAFLR